MAEFPPSHTVQTLLVMPFAETRGLDEAGLPRTLQQTVFRPFLPLGLLIVNPEPGAEVRRMTAGNHFEGELSGSPMPASWFDAGKSLEELRALAERGELLTTVQQRQMLEMAEMGVGNVMTVEVSGKMEAVAFWGLTYRSHSQPVLEVEIEGTSDHGQVTAKVSRLCLAGSISVFRCKTFTHDSAVQLCEAYVSRSTRGGH
jgi:hypothetical protein